MNASRADIFEAMQQEAVLEGEQEKTRTDVEAILAQYIQEAKAEALDEAADRAGKSFVTDEWLRDRAEEIRNA